MGISTALLIMSLVLSSCRQRVPPSADSTSGLSDISMAIPNNKASDGSVLFDNYGLKITTTSNTGACKQSEIVQGDEINQVSLSGISVLQSCDYELTVELGTGGKSSLTKTGTAKGNGLSINSGMALYSNNVPGKSSALKISSAQLRSAGSKFVVPEITVFKVGVKGPDQLKVGGEVDVTIEVSIGEKLNTDPQKSQVSASKLYVVANGAQLQNVLKSPLYKERRLFLQFSGSNCGPCMLQKQAIARFVSSLPVLNRTLFMYIDNPDPALRTNYGISDYPTNVIFEDGQVVKKIAYPLKEEELRSIASE